MIVGHGGTRCGWAVYIKGGALALATRREHEMAVVTSKQKLRAGQVAITATLASDGAVTFAADGKDLGASGKLPGPVYDMPDEPLSVGSDVKSAVGDYPADKNAFPGTIEKLHIQLEK